MSESGIFKKWRKHGIEARKILQIMGVPPSELLQGEEELNARRKLWRKVQNTPLPSYS